MEDGKSLSQERVNEVWSDVWRNQRAASRREIMGNRLFIEGYPVIRKYIPDTAKKILDVGSGTGRYGARLAEDLPASDVYVTDIADESLTVIADTIGAFGVLNARVQKEDMFDLSFPDGMFDAILCDVVIQHVADPVAAIREMLRVLRPGGTIIVTAVNRWNFHMLYKLALRLFRKPYPYGYEKAYASGELAQLVGQAGGSVVATDGFYVAYGVFRLGRIHPFFRVAGKAINRVVKFLDRFTGRLLSRSFGFEVVCVATKSTSDDLSIKNRRPEGRLL